MVVINKHKELKDVFDNMIQRCYNKNNNSYCYYGGRGIKISMMWILYPDSFIKWALQNGYRKGLQIDRINNDKDYRPENCRFVTPAVNTRNSRATKLSSEDVLKIRRLLRIGYDKENLIKKFNITKCILNDIKNHKTWKYE